MTTTKTGQGNVNEGNRIIAEFMGYTQTELSYNEPVFSHPDHSVITAVPLHLLTYHEDWNLLMPVVEKIFNVTTEDQRQFSGNSIFEIGLFSPISDVYSAVLEFITWYNSNK